MIIGEYVKDSFDDVMGPFLASEEYQNKQAAVDELLAAFVPSLSEQQKLQFNALLDAMSNEKASLASEALLVGFVNGTALHKQITGE